MRPAMRESDGERRLRIVSGIARNAGGFARERFAAVRTNDQPCCDPLTAAERDRCIFNVTGDVLNALTPYCERRQLLGFARQRFDQMPVFDVVAECIEADFAGIEFHLRRAQQPAGVVDNAHHAKWRGMAAAQRPNLQRFKCRDGTRKESGGPIVGRGGLIADQQRRDAAGGERNRGGKTCWAAADHDDIRAAICAHRSARP